MKTFKNLYGEICSFENLLLAAEKARRGKRFIAAPAAFHHRLEYELVCLQRELQTGEYRPGRYKTLTIHDPRQRMISAAPYRDRVVHHAICRVIEPLFKRTFIYDSYACRAGKGTHAAVEGRNPYDRFGNLCLLMSLAHGSVLRKRHGRLDAP